MIDQAKGEHAEEEINFDRFLSGIWMGPSSQDFIINHSFLIFERKNRSYYYFYYLDYSIDCAWSMAFRGLHAKNSLNE